MEQFTTTTKIWELINVSPYSSSEHHKMYIYPHGLDASPHFKSEFDAESFT